MATNSKYSTEKLLKRNEAENSEKTYPNDRRVSSPYGGKNEPMVGGSRQPMTAEQQEFRKKQQQKAQLEKLKEIIATKDIYEFDDKEKELFIEFYPHLFMHNEDDIGNAEFITNSTMAELVLSDYFIKKERTKGMDFLFNFHFPTGDEVLN